MTAPILTFRPHALASEIAQLGACTVAAIIPCPGPRQNASWIVKLPDWQQCQGPSSSFDAARRKVEHEVREWLSRAGLVEAAASLVVRVVERQKDKARA